MNFCTIFTFFEFQKSRKKNNDQKHRQFIELYTFVQLT